MHVAWLANFRQTFTCWNEYGNDSNLNRPSKTVYIDILYMYARIILLVVSAPQIEAHWSKARATYFQEHRRLMREPVIDD